MTALLAICVLTILVVVATVIAASLDAREVIPFDERPTDPGWRPSDER